MLRQDSEKDCADVRNVGEMVAVIRKNIISKENSYLPGDCDLSRGLGGVGGFRCLPVIFIGENVRISVKRYIYLYHN